MLETLNPYWILLTKITTFSVTIFPSVSYPCRVDGPLTKIDLETQKKVNETFKNKALWAKKSINAAAGMGKFSSDRSIQEYAERIWKVSSVHNSGAVGSFESI